jgi:pyruvate,orthophosphate dikinase
MADQFPEVFEQFKNVCQHLKNTTEICRIWSSLLKTWKLYMLQTRNGKRTAQAALKIACDLVDEGMRTEKKLLQ